MTFFNKIMQALEVIPTNCTNPWATAEQGRLL